MFWQKDEYTISTDPLRLDIAYIHAWLSGRSYWAEGIPLVTVTAALRGSLCFGVYLGDRQIGLARVITDKATFGYLADVFIDEEYRGQGLSKWLMDTILAHPELQGLRNWMLLTLDAHGLYARSGFGPHAHPERIMTRSDPNIYKRNYPAAE